MTQKDQPAAQTDGSTDTVFEATEFLELYDRILAASDAAARDPICFPGSGTPYGSHFVDPDTDDNIALHSWAPVGRLPHGLVGCIDDSNIRIYPMSGHRFILGVRAGGGIPKGQQRAQKGTEHILTVILNGCFDLEIRLTYDGLDGWQYIPVALPDDLNAADLKGCEVEKDGRLLYSGALGSAQTTAMSDRANLVRFFANGHIEGWATSNAQPDADVFVTVRVSGTDSLLPTSAQWVNSDLRRFQLGIQAAPQTLYPIAVLINEETHALRSPAWGCHDDICGFLLSNPQRQGNDVLVTLVPENTRKFKISALSSLVDGTQFPLSEPDSKNYYYYDGHNTARIPIGLFQDVPTLRVLGGPDGGFLGMLPPLAPLLTDL